MCTDGEEVCENMNMQFHRHKHVALSLSSTSGWGVYLRERVLKNEFIGEYTGELINQQEADRRGKIYDRVNCSFLFNLNSKWCVDARLKGNKFKFANHSATPNCSTRVLMVRGDHRIGIWANDNIAPNTELYYDYRYTDDFAPDWARNNA